MTDPVLTNLTMGPDQSPVKVFFGILQCLHHITIFQHQTQGHFSKAFTNKIHQLNSFIKPGLPDHQIKTQIESINKTWATNISQALLEHYLDRLQTLKSWLISHKFSAETIKESSILGLHRGHKQFGKRLSHKTIQDFKLTITNLFNSKSNESKVKSQNNNSQTHSQQNQNTHSQQNQNKHTKQTSQPKQPTQTSSAQNPSKHHPKNSPHNNIHPQGINPVNTSTIRYVKGPGDPLSNFYPCQFRFENFTFRSLEHAYQYKKAIHFDQDRLGEQICWASNAGQAKQLAKQLPSRDRKWDKYKTILMFQLLTIKFKQCFQFRKELLNCAGLKLVHNVPCDFWGWGRDQYTGKNKFGTLLQDVLIKMTSHNSLHSPRQRHNSPPRVNQTQTGVSKPFGIPSRFTPLLSLDTSNNLPYPPIPSGPSTSSTNPTGSLPIPTPVFPNFPPPPLLHPPPHPTPPPPSPHPPIPTPPPPTLTPHLVPNVPPPPLPHPVFPNIPPPLPPHPTPPPLPHPPPSPPTSPPPLNLTPVPSTLSNTPPVTPQYEPLPLTPSSHVSNKTLHSQSSSPPVVHSTPNSGPNPYSNNNSPQSIISPSPQSSNYQTPRSSQSSNYKTPPASPQCSPTNFSPSSFLYDTSFPHIADHSQTFQINPNCHKKSTAKMSNWSLPEITEPVLVIGDSNLQKISETPFKKIQIESYPGAKIRHITNLITQYPFKNKPQIIILSVGLNDRDNVPSSTTIPSIKNLISSTTRKFPQSSVYVPLIQYSGNLSKIQKNNLTVVNDAIALIKKHATPLPILLKGFRVEEDDIHWTQDTANAILRKWLKNVNLN